MKIIIRYYNSWGILTVQTMKISSKSKVSDLYDQVSTLLGINYQHLKLVLVQPNEKIILDELNNYISNYQIEEGSAIFVQDVNDPFSDMASSFASQFDPSQFLDTSANSVHQDQETLFSLIRLSMLSDIELFLEEREDKYQLINGTFNSGWNSMHLICFLGDEKLYLMLLNLGGDISILSKDGWNCLQIAIWQSHFNCKNTLYQVVNLLLGKNQIDINDITQKGTALHIAAEIDVPDIVWLLLKHPTLEISIKWRGKTALEVAGERTKPILQKELLIFQNKQFDLINSFRSSLCSLYSLTSFYVNKPQKPPIIKGSVKVVKYFKLILVEYYFVCDPESGVIAQLIPLDCINEVKVSKDHWFQDKKLSYIEIKYFSKHIHFAFQTKSGARQWLESIKNSIGYYRYVNNKIQLYEVDKQKKTIYQIMMEKQNQEIEIFDVQQHKQSIEMKEKWTSLSLNQSEYSLQEQAMKLKDLQILQYLGKGTYGQVYKVIYKNKLFALKQQLKQQLIQDLQYAQTEINVMKQVNHPNIVKLHFSFQTQNYLYMLIDYCDKGDLTNFMTRGAIINETTAIFIIAQVILAIEYLHSFNIIYRDLKPENIVVDNNNYVKLIDFGLAKKGYSITHSFCGSPAYLSPELLNGQGVTQSTDIYMIGLILYEMLNGYPPYFSNNIRDLLTNIQHEELKFPKQIAGPMKNVLVQLLSKDPKERLTIKQLKNHIIFAEIDWNKLLLQQYQPPILSKIERKQLTQQIRLIDSDYVNNERINEIFGWDYSCKQ